jgi:hypothetical protein
MTAPEALLSDGLAGAGFFLFRTLRAGLASKLKSKAAAGVRALARRHSKAAVKILAAIMNDEEGPATARVSAAQALLDRGWGKAAQVLAGEEGGLPILARIERVIVDPSLQKNNENGSGTDNGAHT